MNAVLFEANTGRKIFGPIAVAEDTNLIRFDGRMFVYSSTLVICGDGSVAKAFDEAAIHYVEGSPQ